MQQHTVFLIVGESGSGKDSLINKLCTNKGYRQVKSYATRPRRVDEGDTHIFISPSDVNKYRNEMIAYTKIGEYEYFATLSQLYNSDVYAIDYRGIEYMRELIKDKTNLRFVTIYINVPRNVREKRVLNNRKDDEITFYKRCFNEDIQFREMLLKGDFDYSISNVDFKKAYHILGKIVEVESESNS